jgi:RNA-directed DNA polymerase
VMNGTRKSDGPMVPTKRPNEVLVTKEDVEGRGPAKGNAIEQNAGRTLNRNVPACSALERVRQRTRKDKNAKFTALLHHVTVELLREAYRQLQRHASAGRRSHGCSTASGSRTTSRCRPTAGPSGGSAAK